MKLGREVSRHNGLDNWRNTHRVESVMATKWLLLTISETEPGLWDRLIEEDIQDDEEHGSRLFSEELTVGAYRIVEGALDNTVKHSNATMAWVSLSYLPDGNVSLDIGDDGRGFAAGEVSSALGLLFMEDYAAALGGACQIESSPDAGTIVHATLPIVADGQSSGYLNGSKEAAAGRVA